MELVHDWVHNPLATKAAPGAGKASLLEKAAGIFLRALKSGELQGKLQEIKEQPWLVQKARVFGTEASVALAEVVTSNRLPQLKLMMERGYDPCANVALPSGKEIPEIQQNWTIAHEAVMANACETLQELAEHGLDLKKVKSNEGWTLVHAAAYSGNSASLKILLDAGCPADSPDIYKRTPLHWAIICGSFLAAKLLIWHKADLTAQDQWRNSPVAWSQKNPTSELGDYLLRAAAGEFDGAEEPALYDASQEDEEDDDDSDTSEVFQTRTYSVMRKSQEGAAA